MTRLVFACRRRSCPSRTGMIVRRSIDRDADAVALGLLRGEQRPLHERAPREDDDVRALAHDRGLAERDHVVGARVRRLVVGLPIQVLVLAEQHRVVAANRRAQQAGGVLRVRRKHDADARRVREDRDARLAVVRRAAAQVAADRHADHHRARPVVARPVAHHRQLVANLHERRARCSRRTGSRRPASARAAPCRRRGR